MKELELIFNIIESIKKNYSTMKIKVTSIKLSIIYDHEFGKLVQLM